MRVILTSLGYAGDVYPFFALAQALKLRGHHPTLLLDPRFRELAAELEIDFFPLQSPEQRRRVGTAAVLSRSSLKNRRSGAGMLRLWFELMLPNVPILLKTLDDLCRSCKPDWIVYHTAAIGAPWVCRRAGIRCAAATLIPKAWLDYNRGDVHGVAAPDESPAERRARCLSRLVRPLIRTFSDRTLNRIAARCGYPPLRDVFCRQFLDNDLNLGLWSPTLREALPHDPTRGAICGFTWFDGAAAHPQRSARLREFLDDGSPPIVFTLGTGIVAVAGNFYELAAEACRRLGRRGLLLTGSSRNAPRRLPPGVQAFEYVPLSQVLPRGCLTVHHGGIGTTGQALRAGKPMLVIPFVHDQFDNARLLRRTGASLTLDRAGLSVSALTRYLEKLLDHSGVAERAARIGAAVNREDGAARAVTLLENPA